MRPLLRWPDRQQAALAFDHDIAGIGCGRRDQRDPAAAVVDDLAEGEHILAERDAGIAPPSHGGVGYLGLIRCPAMWGLFISQGCLVYTGYLYISWLPNYLQTARHLSMLNSGIYTAIPFLVSTMVGIVANWVGDRLLTAEAVRGGKRRYLVALSLLFTAAGLLIPFVQSLAAVIALITIAVSAAHVGPAANGALVCDLLRSPGDAGRAFAFLVLGGNTFGLLAPIVTGHVVAATGGFNAAFVVAGALALVGAVASLVLARGTLGEHVRPSRARPRLATRVQWPAKLHPAVQPRRCGTIGVGAPKCDPEQTLRSQPRNKSGVPPGTYAQGMRSDHRSGTPSKLPCKLQARRALHGLINPAPESPQRVRPISRH